MKLQSLQMLNSRYISVNRGIMRCPRLSHKHNEGLYEISRGCSTQLSFDIWNSLSQKDEVSSFMFNPETNKKPQVSVCALKSLKLKLHLSDCWIDFILKAQKYSINCLWNFLMWLSEALVTHCWSGTVCGGKRSHLYGTHRCCSWNIRSRCGPRTFLSMGML